MARYKMFFNPARAIRELGLPQTPPAQALADAGDVSGLAIEVVDAPERRKGADGEDAAEEEASPEAELDLSPAPVGRTDDPVRMYLREMGRTPLLTREGEIRIAKRIEEGRKEVADSVCRAAAAVREILYLGERLEQGRLRIAFGVPAGLQAGRYVVPVDVRYGEWDLPQFTEVIVSV